MQKHFLSTLLCGVLTLTCLHAQETLPTVPETVQVSAPKPDSTRTLIRLVKPKKIGFYIAPEMQYGQVAGGYTGFGGSSVMLIFDKKWAFGATAQGSLDRTFSPSSVSPLYVRSRFGGFRTEFTPWPNPVAHLSFPLVVGMGTAYADSTTYSRNRWHRDRDGVFFESRSGADMNAIIQPGINLEINLMRYAKLFVGANYRFSWSVEDNDSDLAGDALQGLSITGGLKVGFFELGLGKRKQVAN